MKSTGLTYAIAIESNARAITNRLAETGFNVNKFKRLPTKDAAAYLGNGINRKGIQPKPKKVEANRRPNSPNILKGFTTFPWHG